MERIGANVRNGIIERRQMTIWLCLAMVKEIWLWRLFQHQGLAPLLEKKEPPYAYDWRLLLFLQCSWQTLFICHFYRYFQTEGCDSFTTIDNRFPCSSYGCSIYFIWNISFAMIDDDFISQLRHTFIHASSRNTLHSYSKSIRGLYKAFHFFDIFWSVRCLHQVRAMYVSNKQMPQYSQITWGLVNATAYIKNVINTEASKMPVTERNYRLW
jgi:hypothetical protein